MNRRDFLASGIAVVSVTAGSGFAQPSGAPVAAANPQGKPPLFPDNAQFWYETMRAFGASSYAGSEFGEVLAAVNRIASGNYDSWYDAWYASAEGLAAEAAGQLARDHRVSARDGFLRAATYYRASEFFLHGNPADPRIAGAYRKSVDTYQSAARLFDPVIEPVEIPYERTTLPGYFHRPDRSRRSRPTILMHSGFDGSAQELHSGPARAAVERGYNVLAFDGPGQYAPLHRERLTFRPDWEKVVTPVVDFTVKQRGVDRKKIALMGISLGGELAPRAAAFEKRIAALIANDGVYDYGAANLSSVPPAQLAAVKQMLKAEQAPGLDAALAMAMKKSPTANWGITHGMYAMGAPTPRAYLAAALSYNLADGVAEKISCPTLVCEAEDDLFFKGQPQQLFDHLTSRKTLMKFTRDEGAGAHCQVGAERLAYARIYDWLDETLGVRA
jgi:dienelactone hydrolase